MPHHHEVSRRELSFELLVVVVSFRKSVYLGESKVCHGEFLVTDHDVKNPKEILLALYEANNLLVIAIAHFILSQTSKVLPVILMRQFFQVFLLRFLVFLSVKELIEKVEEFLVQYATFE